MTDIHQIAAEFQAATSFADNLEIMRTHLAPKVRIEHVPAVSADGVVNRDLIIAGTRAEGEAVTRAVPDGRFSNEVTIKGDWIQLKGRLMGALADGTPIEMQPMVSYEVTGGNIIGIRANSSGNAFQNLLKAGAFQPPTREQAGG